MRHFCPMLNTITLHGKYGEKLSRVGYVIVNGVIVSSDPYHVPGGSHHKLPIGVPTYGVMQELARFSVSNTRSRSYIVQNIKEACPGFPDSKRVITRKESKPISCKWVVPKQDTNEDYDMSWVKILRREFRASRRKV
jgi:hypothetical protein